MLFGGKDSKKNLDKSLENGNKFFDKRKYDKALSEYLKLVKANAADVNLLHRIGDLYAKLNDKPRAIEYYQKVVEHNVQKTFFTKAVAILRKIIRLDNDAMESREQLVDLFVKQNKVSEAKAELNTIADIYLKNNLVNRAIGVFEKLLEIDPQNINSHNQLAECLIREGKNAEACEQYFLMAQKLSDKDMTQQAKMVLTKAFSMQEKHAGLLRLSGDLFFKEGQLEKASDYYKKAIALDSHLLEALKGLGQTARARGDLQEARVSFQRLYQLDNSYLPLLEELADEYIHKGQLDRAYELVQPLADDLAKTPDPQDAVRLLRKILTKDEYYPEANHQLIDIYLQHDRTNNALIALEKIATFLLSQNRRQEAVPYLKQMVEIDPDNLNWRSQLDQIEEQVQSFPGFGAAEEQPEPPLEAVSHDFSLLEAEPQAQEHDLEHFEFEEESSFVEDTQMSIGNLLTEIDVYIRYQQLDKAEKFIDEILAKDPLHFEANQKRKQVFLEKNDFKGVAKTNLILAKHFVDKGQLDIAIDLIDEAGEHFPAEARKLQGEIEHLQNLENSRQNESVQAQAYDPDFTDSSQNVIDLHQDQLVFDQGEQEVVEFKKKTTLFDDFSGDGGDEEWGLDLPVTEEEPVEDPVAFKETEEDELSDDLFLDPELLAEVGRDADDSEEAQQTIEEGVISGLGDTEAEEIPKMEDPPLKHEGLEAAMEEIQFFLSMDAHEEALNLIHTALQNFGPHSELLTKQEELKSALSSTSAGNSDDSNPHDVGIFDLGADVDLAFDMVRDVTDNSVPEEFKNVDELFEQFKKGVAEQVADNDYQTHYDLGIGYKEMGLLDEAINEFRIVLQDPDRFLDANAMIAVCQKELGQSDQAVDTLKTALERNTLKAEERSELLYDLALTQESLGELEDAILTFQELNQHHPGFRDVEERLQDLM